jgi:hypothetical protein
MSDGDDAGRFIERDLAATLEQLEAERLEAMKTLRGTRRRLRIGAFFFVLASMVVAGPFGFFGGSFVAFVGYLVMMRNSRDRLFSGELRERLKRDVVRPLVARLAPAASYHPDGHIPQSDFDSSGLYQVTPRTYRGDDLVEGVLGDTNIRFSELHVEYLDQSSDRSQRSTAFKGLFFVADFHKDFHGYTTVRPRRPKVLGTYFSGASRATKMDAGMAFAEHLMGPRWTPGNARYGPLQTVELEDPEFAEHFDVYSNDQVAARYILSSSMMERLLDFRREAIRAREALSAALAARKKFFQVVDQDDMQSGMFNVSFAHSNVYIAKHHFRDLFEIDPKRSLTGSGQIEEYAADLRFALGIVEDLNLNTRIWSRAPAGQ